MQTYTLFEEFITLGQVLKELGVIATGGQAKIYLAEQVDSIFVNGQAENRRGKKLRVGDILELRSENISVKFDSASAEEIAQYAADKAEKQRVAARVKALNAQNISVKSDRKAKPRSPFHK